MKQFIIRDDKIIPISAVILFISFSLTYRLDTHLPEWYHTIILIVVFLSAFISKEHNFSRIEEFLPIPIIFIIHSIIPALIKAEKVGSEWVEGGGTRTNPVEYEGYKDIYEYSFNINVSNINYSFIIFTTLITILFFMFHYKKIVIKKN